MSLSDNFLLDPVNYCTPIANGGRGKILIVAERTMVGLSQKVAYGYWSVKKGDRVSYCRIAQSVAISQQGQGVQIEQGSDTVAAEVKKFPPNETDYGKKAGEWFPCFYLPWQAQTTYRMTLRHGPGFLDVPRIFVTSTVDGCSVVVEGSAEEPTVYHLNDAGGGGAVPQQTTMLAQQAYWTPKATTMENRFQAAKSPKTVQQAAANPLLPALPGAKGVHAMDYMDVTEAQRPALVTPQQVLIHTGLAKNQVADWVAVKTETPLYKPYGTVFGWKQNTTWRFFYQQRAVIFYMYRVTKSDGTTIPVAIPRQLAFHLDEFWPNGSGVAVGKALVP